MKRIIAMLICVCFFMCGCSEKSLPVISVIDNKFNISSHDFSDALYSVESHKKMVKERILVVENIATHELEGDVSISFRGESGQTRRVSLALGAGSEAGDSLFYCFNDLIHLIYPGITDDDFTVIATSISTAFKDENPNSIYYGDIEITCSVNDNGDVIIGIDAFNDDVPK